MWKKDYSEKSYVKSVETNTLTGLIDYFFNILDSFLQHSFTKRAQSKSFQDDCKEADQTENAHVAILQIDFAENSTCENQDEIQSVHWNQNSVSSLSQNAK